MLRCALLRARVRLGMVRRKEKRKIKAKNWRQQNKNTLCTIGGHTRQAGLGECGAAHHRVFFLVVVQQYDQHHFTIATHLGRRLFGCVYASVFV